jgi:hypothetical protein
MLLDLRIQNQIPFILTLVPFILLLYVQQPTNAHLTVYYTVLYLPLLAINKEQYKNCQSSVHLLVIIHQIPLLCFLL